VLKAYSTIAYSLGDAMAFNNNANAREEMQLLTFSLDNVLYGVNVSQVRK
jgi:chemotaxis signal transduction protein